MADKIRVGICGYGNLGKGAEIAIKEAPDMELKVIFTRRNPEEIMQQTDVPVVSMKEAEKWKEKLDVVILCGGSKKDLPEQAPIFAKMFNTVNTFDTHADIPTMYQKVDEIAKEAGKLSVIATGWDPGLFSAIRKLSDSIFPNGKYYTFWGPGVSQGHSDAIRKIEGVKNAIQYTMPVEEVMDRIRNGEELKLTATNMHKRVCYVVAEAEKQEKIEKEIKAMPKYFEGYDTTVHFVSEEEVIEKQRNLYHEGWVICVGNTGKGHKEVMEFHLKLDSNPEFTASVAVAYARATSRMNGRGETGARVVTEISIDDMALKNQEYFKYI